MIKKFAFTLLFFLGFLNFSSSVALNLEIVGNDRITDETIIVYGEIKDQSDYSKEDVNDILKNLFETEFFEDVKVSYENKKLKIFVKEYPTINIIQISGEKANKVKKVILDNINSKEKGPFITSNVAKDIIIIKSIYEALGFNFAEVDANIEKFSENRLNLNISISKGNQLKISKINFIGDKKIKEKRLRDIIVSEENKIWKFLTKNTNLSEKNIELDKRLLENYYKNSGYYDVQILSTSATVNNNKSATVTYNINAGKKYRISKISSNIDPSLNKKVFLDLDKEFKKIVGEFYSPFKVKKLLENLDLLIAENDLQFIEHSVNEIVNSDFIEIVLNIYEGEKKLVEKVNITGNTVTNESVIRSALLLDEGDPFNRLKLDQTISLLKSKNIFGDIKHSVKDGELFNSKIIDINVEEKPTGEITAGAGFGTDGGTLSLGVTENNWLGRGINLSSFLDFSADTFKGKIAATNPNYNYSGNSLGFYVGSTDNDSTTSGYENSLIQLGVNTSFEQYKDVYLSPALQFTSDKMTVQDKASDKLKKQAGTFTDLTFDYGVSLDKRDRSFMPTDGYFLSFSQGIPVYADSPSLSNNVSFATYNSFTEGVIGSFKFYASSVNGFDEDVRLSKRKKLPTSRLRGFESGKIGPKDGSDYVGGNYASSFKFDANFPNFLPESTKTDVSLFFDIGNNWGVDYDSSIDDSNKWRSSVGINTVWLSPLGPMTVIFAENITKASTDVTQGFKFQLGTTF
tara:strand:- start:1283 stop:3511 length:2229 start_codon:yes stop_codon:yes gene_type:complete